MKALIFRETGEPSGVLQLAEIPTPPLAPGEALVRVLLSPINPSDLHMVRGRYGYQPELPASPGTEGVGIVEAVGPGVEDPSAGGRIKSGVRLSEARKQELVLTYQQTIQQAFRGVSDSLVGYEKNREFREHQEQLVLAAQDAARLSE